MAPRFVAQQLSNPTGFFGAIIRILMNRNNAGMNAFALKVLDAGSGDHVLEIGFGGGVTLPGLLASGARVTGLDRSDDVVRNANARFQNLVKTGRATFRQGKVEQLPFADSAFTRVLTVNTVYFWESLDQGFREIYRVLAPASRAAIGFLPKEHMDRMNMPSDIFTPRTPESVIDAMTGAGFREVRALRHAPDTRWNVVVAEKP